MIKFLRENAIFVVSSALLVGLVVNASSFGKTPGLGQESANAASLTDTTDTNNSPQATPRTVSSIKTEDEATSEETFSPTPLPTLSPSLTPLPPLNTTKPSFHGDDDEEDD